MDLAALKIPGDKLDKLGWSYACFKKDDIFSENVLTDERIGLGMPLLVLGYPKDFCDRHNYDPIARSATVALRHWWAFKEKRCFLIDGTLNEGMSGSPVITFETSDETDSQDVKTAVRGKEARLLGVFSAEWGVEGEPLGLNTVWPADEIPRVIEKLGSFLR